MKAKFVIIFLLAGLPHVNAQFHKKIMLFLQPEETNTLKDRTKENNQSGFGVGIQTVFSNASHFSPLINITADAILADDKVFRTNADGSEMESIDFVLKMFAGAAYRPVNKFYLSVIAGPSFINGQTLFGISPAAGIYFSRTKRFNAIISYCNIFNRNSGEKMNYSSLNFSIGLRLY